MLWFEIHSDGFKRIIQADDFAHAITQFVTMHPTDKIMDAKRI